LSRLGENERNQTLIVPKPRDCGGGTRLATTSVPVSERDMPKLIVFVLALIAVSISLALSAPH